MRQGIDTYITFNNSKSRFLTMI